MKILLSGVEIANKQNLLLKSKVDRLKIKPKLVVISVGNDKSSKIYIRSKAKATTLVGIDFKHYHFEKATTLKIVELIQKMNKDKTVSSILVQLPLPKNINRLKVLESVAPFKDVDAFTSHNKGLLETGDAKLIPCTALAIVELLEHYRISLKRKDVTIIGTSQIVGIPVSKILLNKGCTITLCNKNTKSLKNHTKNADIIISATGIKNLIKKDYVKNNSVVVSVGIKREGERIFGDVDFENVESKVFAITPTPGGVGPLTISNLLRNILICYNLLRK